MLSHSIQQQVSIGHIESSYLEEKDFKHDPFLEDNGSYKALVSDPVCY